MECITPDGVRKRPPSLGPRFQALYYGSLIRWLRHHRVLGPQTLASVIYYFGYAASYSLLVVLVIDELDAPPAAFGVLLAAGAGGAFLGSMCGARISSALGTRTTLAGSVALRGGGLVAVAAATSLPVVAALWFLNGIPAATSVRWSFTAGGIVQLIAAMVTWRVLARLRPPAPRAG